MSSEQHVIHLPGGGWAEIADQFADGLVHTVAGLHGRHPDWQIAASQGTTGPAVWSARPWAQRAEPTDGPWPVTAATAEELDRLLGELEGGGPVTGHGSGAALRLGGVRPFRPRRAASPATR